MRVNRVWLSVDNKKDIRAREQRYRDALRDIVFGTSLAGVEAGVELTIGQVHTIATIALLADIDFSSHQQ